MPKNLTAGKSELDVTFSSENFKLGSLLSELLKLIIILQGIVWATTLLEKSMKLVLAG
jgi:hypothetical protein